MHTDLPYRIALTLVPQIGCVQARILVAHFENVESIFKTRKSELEKIEGIGLIRARAIKSFYDFQKVEKEIAFIEKYNIQALFLTDKNYPQRLLHCYDPPTLLYYKGTVDLNSPKTIAIIGTRSNSDYGKQLTERLIREISELNVVIASGLAFGIDAIAHRAALKNKLPTIGVLAHGLNKIYPSEHSALAKEMIQNGGLLTEFRNNIKPDKHNFPIRNRIVAGMTDATIVIETGIKGGSMITAGFANEYNRDVFAFPGKITDIKSAGCNYLIKSNKAVLLTDAQQLIDYMGWSVRAKSTPASQKELFIQLTEDEKEIVDILKENETTHIDELNIKSGIANSATATAILSLELKGIVRSLPGKLFALNT
jgi:DNA processing protein